MIDHWISAAEAYDRVNKVNPFRAAEAICTRAFDGLIEARADVLIVGDKRVQDANVPSEFWWAMGQLALKQNWASGDFETWINGSLHCRAYAVKFSESDINAMLPSRRALHRISETGNSTTFAPASQCITELQKQLDCSKAEAADHILRFCRARLIDSRCTDFWCEVTDRYGASEEETEGVAIPAWFWENCAGRSDSIMDWHSGTFAGQGLIEGEVRKVRIRGAEFDVSGIIEMEAMLRQDAKDAPPSGLESTRETGSAKPVARGGRPKSENWTNWIAELVAHIHEEGIPSGEGADGQDALIGAVEERLLGKGLETLSRSTVQPAARAVLVRLRSAEN